MGQGPETATARQHIHEDTKHVQDHHKKTRKSDMENTAIGILKHVANNGVY